MQDKAKVDAPARKAVQPLCPAELEEVERAFLGARVQSLHAFGDLARLQLRPFGLAGTQGSVRRTLAQMFCILSRLSRTNEQTIEN
jgi:hypothetical protein